MNESDLSLSRADARVSLIKKPQHGLCFKDILISVCIVDGTMSKHNVRY